jgi:hypothetical protein
MAGGVIKLSALSGPFKATVVLTSCDKHVGCTEYSVIPDDPTQSRYERHSATVNPKTDELSLEELQAILYGTTHQSLKSVR